MRGFVGNSGRAAHFGVILSEAKEPCLNACPLRSAQGDSC